MDIQIKDNPIFGYVGLKIMENLPKIAAVIGTAAVGYGTYKIAKATTKLEETVEKSVNRVEEIKLTVEELNQEDFPEEDKKDILAKNLTRAYAKTAWDFTKLYAPGIAIEVAGLVILNTTIYKLDKQCTELGVTITALTAAMNEYRKRVQAEVGVDKERDIFTGRKTETVVTEETDENGIGYTKETKETTFDPVKSPYSFIYDSSSRQWEDNSYMNFGFLIGLQRHFSDLLRTRGYLYLNEILLYLDIPTTKTGQYVGWYYDKTKSMGDNFVSFGIPATYEQFRLLYGDEPNIWLDFNCQGNIQDLAHNRR